MRQCRNSCIDLPGAEAETMKHSLRGTELTTKGRRQSHWLLLPPLQHLQHHGPDLCVCVLHLVQNVRLIISHLWSRTSRLSSLFLVEYCLPESTVSHSLTLSRSNGELFQTFRPPSHCTHCAHAPQLPAQATGPKKTAQKWATLLPEATKSPEETAPGNMSF